MILITRHNYEAYLLDYIEGNLSEQDTAGLMRFLHQNPDLKEDLEDFDWVTLTDETADFEGKEDLKIQAEVEELLIGRIEKINSVSDETRLNALLLAHPQFKKDEKEFAGTILADKTTFFEGKEGIKLQAEIEELLLGSIENQNTANEEAKLKSLLLANPQFAKEAKKYAATILVKETIVFPYKSDLKQETKVVPIYFWYSAIAASVIGFMATFGWNTETSVDLQYSSNEIILSTPSIALERLPSFSVFDNYGDSSQNEEVEPVLIPISNDNVPNDNMASAKSDFTLKNSSKPDSTNTKIAPLPIEIIHTDEIAEVIDSLPAVMDRVLKSTDPTVINPQNDNIAMSQANEEHSLGEYINYKTREKVFGDSDPTYSAIQSNEVLSNVAKGLDKITASKVSFKQEQTEKGRSTQIKIGRFELYRSSR